MNRPFEGGLEATAGISIVFSTEGGMDIEEVADKHPEKIISALLSSRHMVLARKMVII